MKRYISLGAGVQSTTLLLMALHGEFGERPDGAIFSDTGWEPKAVYDHLRWLRVHVAQKWRFPVYRVSVGNIKEDTLGGKLPSAVSPSTRFVTMPHYVPNAEGRSSALRRQCTNEYKLRPLRRKLRSLVGAGPVEVWIGISFDEWKRMKDSGLKWAVNRWPLVERRMGRTDCLNWLKANGYPAPPKSACIACPFHDNGTWREMKLNDPASFAEAVAFDGAIRNLPRIDGEVFLHSSLKPLAEIDFSNQKDRGQIDLFDNDCEGLCGV
jgi:hypothetical protein